MTQKERMYQQIQKHGENLNAIFHTGLDPIKLCKRLRSLENKAHKLATDYCNGDVDTDKWEIEQSPILAAVRKVLYPNGMTNSPLDCCIFINGDARGYALKIKEDYVRNNNLTIYRDWGGYGILAPEFDGKE